MDMMGCYSSSNPSPKAVFHPKSDVYSHFIFTTSDIKVLLPDAYGVLYKENKIIRLSLALEGLKKKKKKMMMLMMMTRCR